MEKAEEKQIDEIVDRMLQLYFLLDSNKPADAKEEEKKVSPSKQAAQPARTTQPTKVKQPPRPGSAAPLKATVPRNQLNDTQKDEAAQQKRVP